MSIQRVWAHLIEPDGSVSCERGWVVREADHLTEMQKAREEGRRDGIEEAAKRVVEYAGGSEHGKVNLLKLAGRIRTLKGDTP
jgi:hypothetical protein